MPDTCGSPAAIPALLWRLLLARACLVASPLRRQAHPPPVRRGPHPLDRLGDRLPCWASVALTVVGLVGGLWVPAMPSAPFLALGLSPSTDGGWTDEGPVPQDSLAREADDLDDDADDDRTVLMRVIEVGLPRLPPLAVVRT